MGEFLLVIPEGWVSLDWTSISNNVPSFSMMYVLDKINNGGLQDIETALKEYSYIPLDKSLISAKLIDDTYFMVQLG